MPRFISRTFYVAFAFLILAPSAWADTVHAAPALTLQSKQTWVVLIGALVPLVTYVLNHVGPWASEPVKAFITVLASAVAGGLYTALATTSFGWNTATLQMVLTAVVATLGAHHFLWKPSTIAARLGGGSNPTGGRRHLGWVSSPPAEPAPPAE